MREDNLHELLAAAQTRVRSARTRLARPRACNLDECVTLLREAQGYLEWLRDSLRSSPPGGRELREPAAALGREIRETGVLLECAARFGRRWLEQVRARYSGYTSTGVPGPLPPGGCLSVLG